MLNYSIFANVYFLILAIDKFVIKKTEVVRVNKTKTLDRVIL